MMMSVCDDDGDCTLQFLDLAMHETSRRVQAPSTPAVAQVINHGQANRPLTLRLVRNCEKEPGSHILNPMVVMKL